MVDAALQFAAILATVAGLLGWLMRQVITHFIASDVERTGYLEKLVAQNQGNTEKFTETINHQRTLDRDMQEKHLAALRELRDELRVSNRVNGEVLEVLKRTV